MSYIGFLVSSGGIDKSLSVSAVDSLIDKDHSSVDENLEKMKKAYGAEELEKMSPGDFYRNYKRFANGSTF